MTIDRAGAIRGALLGTALGDALGLACEGMSARAIVRRFGRVEDFHIFGRTGLVSDDTEQSALVVQSIARTSDVEGCRRAFRRAMLGWFVRLPWGIGLGTIRACLKLALGLRDSGVMSAGNGAAMRSGAVGVVFHDDEVKRHAYARALAEVTHRDPRAVEGALFVAELAAACARTSPAGNRFHLVDGASTIVSEASLADALRRAGDLAESESSVLAAGETLGSSGFVIHSVPLATFAFLRFGDAPLTALAELIAAGGDTDTSAAILGGWLGALHGEAALPAELVGRIHDGPFGPSHLRALAEAVAGGEAPPRYSALAAFARNVAMYPVVIAHGLRRIFP